MDPAGTAGSAGTGTPGAAGTTGTAGRRHAGTTGTAGRGGTTGAGGTTSACTTTGTGGTAAPPTCTSNPADYTYPFQDPCRPIEDRITNLLSVLTVAEKLGLMNEYQLPVDRLGIKAYTTFVEGVHGIGWSGDPATPATSTSTSVLYLTGTQFPQAYGLAESWDPEALRTVGMTTGYEARVWNAAKPPNAQGRGVGLVVRAPLVDLGRDPRWGRTEEGYGEDPFLTAALANGYIAGLHGTDPVYLQAASTLKHWLGNNNETNRNTSSSNIDDRNLREYYGYPFEQAIRIGKAKGMMSAYNKLAGTSSAVSPLLKSLVIGEWGFDGTLCTDAWGPQVLVNDQMAYANLPAAMAAIIKGGTGLILQDQADARPAVMTAYSGGMITVADIDAASRANLRVRFRLGDFDPPARVPYKSISGTATPWNTAEYKTRALDVARKTRRAAEEHGEHAAAGEDRIHHRRGRRAARRHGAARLVRRPGALQDHRPPGDRDQARDRRHRRVRRRQQRQRRDVGRDDRRHRGRTGDRVRGQPPDLRQRAARAEPRAVGDSARRRTRDARRSTAR